jgi:GAF domain-containing protein
LEDLGDAWFALPLRSRNQVVGVVVLGQPRARRQLTWEDKDLLGILSVQIASYVVEEQATRSLAAVQRFEQVGKRFTFIAHDLKNLVSQLTLVLHHAEQHGPILSFGAMRSPL